jgi:Trypsin
LLAVAAGALVVTAVPGRASAVVGGEPVASSAVPWFVSFPDHGCAGTLIAADRLITAAHCVAGLLPADLGRVRVGREVSRAVHIALAPGWETAPGGPYLDDIAIVGLDPPVTRVTPMPLRAPGARLPRHVRLLGRGRTVAPGQPGNAQGQLREAVLASVGDGACARIWRHQPGNDGERFSAARMLCAIDADGRAPLSSGCNGDSGGPVYSGTDRRPRLLGVISWGGKRCGADHLPSVAAEVARDRDFVLAPDPVWAPRPTSPVHISGDPRVGDTLTCTPPAFDAPVDAVTIQWLGNGVLATGPSYTVQARDAGYITCRVTASTAGGLASIAASVPIASRRP